MASIFSKISKKAQKTFFPRDPSWERRNMPPTDWGSVKEAIERDIARMYSRGNPSLSSGKFLSSRDIARLRAAVLEEED